MALTARVAAIEAKLGIGPLPPVPAPDRADTYADTISAMINSAWLLIKKTALFPWHLLCVSIVVVIACFMGDSRKR